MRSSASICTRPNNRTNILKTKRPSHALQAFEKALALRPAGKYFFRLYVAGATTRSRQALRRVYDLCEAELKGKYELEVIDVYQQPNLARDNQIVATPTFVKEFPKPMRRFIGNLTNLSGHVRRASGPVCQKLRPRLEKIARRQPSSRPAPTYRTRRAPAPASPKPMKPSAPSAAAKWTPSWARARRADQVFTLRKGAEHAYRVLIESMNEGALTLTADKTILYANQCFARMVKCPLEQVMGSSLRRFLSTEDRALLRPLMKRGTKNPAPKIQVLLKAGDGSQLPVQISVRSLAKSDFNGADRQYGADRHDRGPGAAKKCCGP